MTPAVNPDIHHIYIAGPMTGLPEWNFPLFNSEALRLRELGYDVVNPAELHNHTNLSWEYYMRAAIRALMRCDTIFLLPNWSASKGARIEWLLAESLNFNVVYTGEL